MSSRRLENQEDPIRRRIELGKMGARISGPGMSLSLVDVWVEAGGQRVTEVEVGQEFVVKAKYSASYPELGWLADVWTISITASDGKTVNLYDNTSLAFKDGTGTMVLDNPKPAVMPDEDVRLVIQPWGSDKASDYFIAPPKPWI